MRLRLFLTQWVLVALETNVRQQVGFNGGLGSLQDSSHHQINYPRGSTDKIDHFSVAHIAHICGVHLGIENKKVLNM